MTRQGGAIILQGATIYSAGQRRVLWDALLALVDCKDTVRELRGVTPGRHFVFDLAWPAHRMAVELQGGVYTRGHHVRGREYEQDCWKVLLATAAGWRVLPLTWNMLAHNLQEIAQALNQILACENPQHQR